MSRVILQFSTSLEWSSAIIRRICHSRFSHVDFVLPDGNMLGASDSPTAPAIAGNPRGVAIRPPDYQPFGIRRRITIATDKFEAIYTAARSQLGKPFDNAALHQFLSGVPAPPWHDTGQWFCAEHAAWSFWTCAFWPFKLAVNLGRLSPAELIILLNPHFDADELERPTPGLVLGSGEAT